MTTIPPDPGLTTYNNITIYDLAGLVLTAVFIVLMVIPPFLTLLTYGLMSIGDCDD